MQVAFEQTDGYETDVNVDIVTSRYRVTVDRDGREQFAAHPPRHERATLTGPPISSGLSNRYGKGTRRWREASLRVRSTIVQAQKEARNARRSVSRAMALRCPTHPDVSGLFSAIGVFGSSSCAG